MTRRNKSKTLKEKIQNEMDFRSNSTESPDHVRTKIIDEILEEVEAIATNRISSAYTLVGLWKQLQEHDKMNQTPTL